LGCTTTARQIEQLLAHLLLLVPQVALHLLLKIPRLLLRHSLKTVHTYFRSFAR
jgi:hypothetical protein